MADSCVVHLWVLSAGLSPAALRVYIAICAHAGKRSEAWPSQSRLASLCACSVDQVRRAVAELKQRGFIKVIPLHGRRHLTYVVIRRVGQEPPSPCIFNDGIPASAQGEVLREEVKRHTDPASGHRRRQQEVLDKGLDQKTIGYIEDLCYAKTLNGLVRSPHAYKRELIQRAANGELNMDNAEMIHQLAAELRAAVERNKQTPKTLQGQKVG